MRLLIDTLVALMLAGLLGGILLYRQQDRTSDERIEQVQQSLQRIRQQVVLHAAMADTDLTGRGFPAEIDPEWFADSLPENSLAQGNHPWVEIASRGHADLRNPPVRVLLDESYATFWYNPYQGLVRARVPGDVSDERALQFYNRINGTRIDLIVDQSARRSLVEAPPEG
ncbi:MAG: hypothetical protein ACF8NJ_08005 [Phycisphaerales bacterium JB038]